MNKNRFRIIFNPSRGVLMAVAETVKAHGSAANTSTNPAGPISLTDRLKQTGDTSVSLRPLAFSLLLALGMVSIVPNPINIPAAFADIIADQTAPKNQQPIILNAPNGVPLVNIQTPSAAGVSRNTYSQFNVNSNGAILNNSRSNVQTQLGGWVQGNPYLATGSARIILNEVNSQNPSLLNGYVEVAGSRAQVVIANPAGISCNGCGFINASRATLTTGTPIMNNGDLMGYRVGGGTINFLGTGLDASQTDYTDIIARAVQANAGLWASKLNVITGTNQVNVASNGDITGITPIAADAGSSTPAFAIDVAALGGMYAGKIMLVGTEAGVGVRNAGMIGASAGNLTLDVNGMLINSGNMTSVGTGNNVTLQARGISNSGTIASQNNIAIQNTGDTTNTGLINSSRELVLDTSGALTNNQGTISAQRLALSATSLANMHGDIQQTGTQAIAVRAQGITNQNGGLIGNVPISAGTGTGSGGSSTGSSTSTTTPPSSATGGGSTTVVTVAPVVLADGVITITGDVINDGGQITANGNMDVTASSGLTNTATLNLNKLTVTGNSFSNANGEISVAQASINTTTLDNSNGEIYAADSIVLTSSGNLDNTQGEIASGNTILIEDTNASTPASKTLAIINTDGTLIAQNNLSIDSASLTGDGSVLSKGDLATRLTSDFTNNGEWQADGNANFETTGILTNQAKLLAGNALNLTAGTLDNQANGEIVGTTLHLNATDTHTLTNRGLIDGGDTFIDSVTLNNIGTGRIYGDHVAIAATTLTNDVETVNGVTTSAVIAARDRLDIGATTITNREHALLFSAGDMAIGGNLDGNHEATITVGQPQATTLNNNSATIEALGNLNLNVATINNTNDHFTTAYGVVSESTTPARAVNMAGPTQSPAPAAGNTRIFQAADGAYTPIGPVYNYDEVSFYTAGFTHMVANGTDAVYFWQFNSGTIVNETHVVTSDPGQILAGGNATFNATNLLNDNSKIIAGGALNANVVNLNNQETLGTRSSQYTSQSSLIYPRSSSSSSRVLIYSPGDTAPVITTINLGSSTYLGNTAYAGSGTQISDITTGTINQTITNSGSMITLPTSSLFTTQPNSANGYLIATDPRFANYRNWLSSDYMLNAMALDPALMQKRLGDGFYEQKLIREQVAQLTGRRFLTGYANDETQYQALMTNGVTFAQAHQIVPGIALTDTQVAQLTSDIVWLVEKTVTLADGSTQQVLAPQVYVRLQPRDISNTGSLLSADSINLNLTGDPATGAGGTLVNSGTIAGRSVTTITADNINNLKGHITGGSTRLTAVNDINNLGGSIEADNVLSLQAGRDINVASTTLSNQLSYDAAQKNKTVHLDLSRTNIDRIAGLYVSNPNGILVASANNDINLHGAVVSNTGSDGTTVIDAGNDLNLGTVATAANNSYVRDARNYSKNSNTQEVGTVIQTDGDLTLNADRDITARAADVTSTNGALNVAAGNNLTIESGIATNASESASYKKKSGFLSSKSKTTRNTANSTDVISSTFSGDTVNLSAGRPATGEESATGEGNINIRGSNIVATTAVNINASNNINIESAQATHDETHYSKTKKSGFTASSTSVGYGSSKLSTTNDTQTTTNVASTVGSIEDSVNINAGKDYTQTASDVLTPAGDINITAQNVTIQAGTDTYANQQSMKYKQTGITLAVTNPVISAIQTANQMSKAANNTSDGRMQALAAGTTALAAKNAFDSTQQALSAAPTGNGITDAANQVGGINVSLSIGTSKSSSKSSQTSTTAASSHVTAGGDINISAVRPALVDGQNEGAGTINVIGSQIKAANDVTLKADDQINLQASQNIDTLNSKNKNSSASLGVSVGTSSGLAVTASASQGKGKTTGNGTTWTETQVQGGNQQGDKVSLNSGTDTNLTGAQVTGNQVQANVGTSGTGNLNIQSLQDTNYYKDKQKSTGISVSVPIGAGVYGGSISASNSNTKSNYASVNEQAGIMAGDGGFQVNVNGNTNLTGAVIASTDQAANTVDINGKPINSLATQTLTTSNIQNKAAYEANASSATIGGGLQAGLPQLSGAGIGHDEGKVDGVTVSAISQGTVDITDSAAQQTLTGKDGKLSVATLNRDVHVNEKGETVDSQGNSTAGTIAPIFDKEKVAKEIQAQVKITQAFSQQAPVALNSFVQEKTKPYTNAQKVVKETEAQLVKETNSETRIELQNKINQAYETMADTQEDYEKWKENGDYRIASNIIIAAISGGTSGAATAVTKESLSWAADVMRQNMIKDSEQFAGICVAGTNDCISNKSGISVGVNEDGIKVAGGRIVLADWCDKGRCDSDSSTKSGYKENADGTVIFNAGIDENGRPVTINQFIEKYADKYELRSPLGGAQGGEGQMKILGIQFDYAAGSFWDKLAEAYSGTHDTLNSFIWYDEMGNGKALDGTLIGKIGSVGNITNVAVATPFALSVLLPPEVWGAVFSTLKSQ